jgi:hypothetical protein
MKCLLVSIDMYSFFEAITSPKGKLILILEEPPSRALCTYTTPKPSFQSFVVHIRTFNLTRI